MRGLFNAVRTGLAEIWAHKTRSALSFLAIAAGSVVFIDAFAVIMDTYSRLERQREFSGIARMKIVRNQAQSYASTDEYVQPPEFTYEDARRLREKVPEFHMVSPVATSWRTVMEYSGERIGASLAGVTPEWARRDFGYTLRGRFIDRHDVENNMRVCVLIKKAPPPPSSSAAKTMRKIYDYNASFDRLVAHNDLLGRAVKLNDITFTVIGVAEELPYSKRPDNLIGGNMRSQVLVPITSAANYGLLRGTNMEVFIDSGDEEGFPDAVRKVENFLKISFGDSDFFLVQNQMEMIRDMIASRIKSALVTISLGMLAFLAGGIGIMNVTLATVFARTREIGVRRAIGASRSDIMLQFMVEAVMLGLIGGVLGSALGWLWGVPLKVMFGMGASPIKLWMPLIAVLIAAFTAFVFAIYPAWVAAGLKPADALRAE